MDIFSLLFLFISFFYVCGNEEEEAYYDARKTLGEYVASFGYNLEIHKVTTDDGYVLTLWRIPKKITEKGKKKKPILLQHGLMDNAFSWLYKHIERNFVIILANLGYDVWLGNNRGNIYSLEHKDNKNFNWRDPTNKYWDFSVDEMGMHDLPAMFDYILNTTENEKLVYVGHSQGTAQFHILACLDPEFINKKVQAYIGLSPVLYVENAPGLFLQLFSLSHFVDILYWLSFKNFWSVPFLTRLYVVFINYCPWLLPFIVQMICGWTKNQTIDLKRVPVISSSEPGGTSVQNMLHWLQRYRAGGFGMFDFGFIGNMKKYGQPVPPEYPVKNLKKLSIPIYVLYAKEDNLIGWNDLVRYLKLLPSGYKYEEIDDYGHLDYIWADNAHVKIYPQIAQFIKEHSK